MRRFRIFFASLLLAILTLAVFGRVGGFLFLNYDDNLYIWNNPAVKSGISPENLLWAIKPQVGNWHPLTWLSHQLDVQLFGLRPGPHHVVNAAIHGANAVLLLFVFLGLAGNLWPSLLASALFAIHPLHVESVAWVTERKDVLSAFFWMLTMLAWVGYLRRPGTGRYLLALLLFALGLTAKPMLVSLPLVLLILDYWPLGRFRPATPMTRKLRTGHGDRYLLAEKIPFLLVAAISCAITWKAQTLGVTPMVEASILPRLANAIHSYAVYLMKTVWPSKLGALYPHPLTNLPWHAVLLSAAAMAGLTIMAFIYRRDRPYLWSGWLWYVVTLVPVIGIIQVGAQARADRYTYLPLIGVFMAIAWLAVSLVQGKASGRALAAAAAVSVAALSVAAWFQVGYWRDNFSILGHTARVTKDNWVILNNLGQAYLDDKRSPGEALPYFLEALSANPRHANALYNLGIAYYRLGRYSEAYNCFVRVLRLTPTDLDSYNNLAASLVKLGRPGEAVRYYEYIHSINPSYPNILFNLGFARSLAGTNH